MTQIPENPTPALRVKKERKINRLQAYLLANEQRYKPKLAKTIIDLDQVNRMAAIGCTSKEIAALLKVSQHWVDNEIATNPDFALAIELGRSEMKQSLRRAQLEVALNGNPAMLIWLGKQNLDQRDKHDVTSTHTEVNVLVTACMNDLDKIDKQVLLDARQVLRNGLVIDNQPSDAPGVNGGGVEDQEKVLSNPDSEGVAPPG